jgi:hypothetical protein
MKSISGWRPFLRTSAAAAGLALLVSATLTPAAATTTNQANMKHLVGTWRVTVTTFNCTTKVENKPFVSLLTFGVGRTLIETTSSPQFRPGQRSTGHGLWERTGPDTFRAFSEAYIQFTTDPAPPPPAPALKQGRQTIDQGIQMTSRDTFVSDASVAFFDSTSPGSTAPYFTGCARATGVRFE